MDVTCTRPASTHQEHSAVYVMKASKATALSASVSSTGSSFGGTL